MRICDNCNYVSEPGEWIYMNGYGEYLCESCGDKLIGDDDWEVECNDGGWFGTEIQEGDE